MTLKPNNGTIAFRAENGIAYVMLDRPDARNAVNGKMQQDLEEVWPEINHTKSTKVAIISGQGPDFCADNDPEPEEGSEALEEATQDWIGFYAHKDYPGLEEDGLGPVTEYPGLVKFGLPDRARGRAAKPLIVAVNGVCSGSGLSFVASADIVICSDDAEFFNPHINASEAPLEETLAMIKLKAAPRSVVLRMAYMGNRYRVDPQRALQMGMVTEVVPRASLLDRATEIANAIAEASAAATQGVVATFWDTWNLPYDSARFFGQIYGQQARTIDGQEGALAWTDGRSPNWPSETTWSPPWPPLKMKS
jgi:enoyl-CoA hydratase/carnithine racemase